MRGVAKIGKLIAKLLDKGSKVIKNMLARSNVAEKVKINLNNDKTTRKTTLDSNNNNPSEKKCDNIKDELDKLYKTEIINPGEPNPVLAVTIFDPKACEILIENGMESICNPVHFTVKASEDEKKLTRIRRSNKEDLIKDYVYGYLNITEQQIEDILNPVIDKLAKRLAEDDDLFDLLEKNSESNSDYTNHQYPSNNINITNSTLAITGPCVATSGGVAIFYIVFTVAIICLILGVIGYGIHSYNEKYEKHDLLQQENLEDVDIDNCVSTKILLNKKNETHGKQLSNFYLNPC